MSLTWQQSIGVEQSHCSSFTCASFTSADLEDENKKTYLIHSDIIKDLEKLFGAAKKDGQEIAIISSYRSFEKQLMIWNDKWRGYRPIYSKHGRPLNISAMSNIEKYKAISLWSALPGLSRHHWGCDLDIFSASAIQSGHSVALTPEEFSKSGICSDLNIWLNEHLEKFGFFRPYSDFKGGVAIEPWHISHQKTSHEILEDFNFTEFKKYFAASDICESDFIVERLPQYIERYFENIC
jgi:LAS superfamily LD-carboxypeptidase LdcB